MAKSSTSDQHDNVDDDDAFAVRDAAPRLRSPRVIYEDADVLAVDKPAGMSFHSDDLVYNSPGVLTTVRNLQESGTLEGSEYTGPLHSVHRLDKVTSGVLLFAKSETAAAALSAQFQRRAVHKYYVALSARKPSKKMGTVSGDLRKSRRGAYKLTRGGDSAVTRFVSRGVTGAADLEFASNSNSNSDSTAGAGRPLRLLLMKPLTVKTHQLRVACKSLGAPVLGDATYAGAAAAGEDRAYLHAAAIRIQLPYIPTGKKVEKETERCDRDGIGDRDGNGNGGGGGRVIQIVCKPSEGVEWLTEAFDEAWRELGFGVDDDSGGAAAAHPKNLGEWFPENKLLRSSLDDL